MKNLLSLVFSCALLLSLPQLALAQMDQLKDTTPEQRAQMQTKWMENNLSLDAKTSASVAAINLKYAKETESLMAANEPKFKKLMAFKENSNAKDAELKAIFTPEQYSLYEQKKSEMESTIMQKVKEKHQAAQ
jgi:hypothetical protein